MPEIRWLDLRIIPAMLTLAAFMILPPPPADAALPPEILGSEEAVLGDLPAGTVYRRKLDGECTVGWQYIDSGEQVGTVRRRESCYNDLPPAGQTESMPEAVLADILRILIRRGSKLDRIEWGPLTSPQSYQLAENAHQAGYWQDLAAGKTPKPVIELVREGYVFYSERMTFKSYGFQFDIAQCDGLVEVRAEEHPSWLSLQERGVPEDAIIPLNFANCWLAVSPITQM